MYTFDRWQVKEDPALGSAVVTLWLNNRGLPEGDPFPAMPSLVSQVSGFGDNIISDDARRFVFHIKSKPWHKDGLRPFACDAFAQQRLGGVWYPLVLFVISAETMLDRDDFDQKISQNYSKIAGANSKLTQTLPKMKVLRLMNKAQIPDLFEPINLPDLLRAEMWSIKEACINDWSSLQQSPEDQEPPIEFQLVTSEEQMASLNFMPIEYIAVEKELRSSLDKIYDDWIRVSQYENQLIFDGGPAEIFQSPESVRWRLTVNWSDREPAHVLWSFDSPYRYKNEKEIAQCRLCLLVSSKVKENLRFEIFNSDGKDLDGYELDPSDLRQWISFDPVRIEVGEWSEGNKSIATFNERSENFTVIYPARPNRSAELLFLHRDPTLILSLVLLPLMIFPSPAQPVAIALEIALSFGSAYCAAAEQAHVVKHGYDSTWQPRSIREVESDLLFAVAGIILSSGGVVLEGSHFALRILKETLRKSNQLEQAMLIGRRLESSLILLTSSLSEAARGKVASEVFANGKLFITGNTLKDEAVALSRFSAGPKYFQHTLESVSNHAIADSGTVHALMNELSVSRVLSTDKRRFQIESLQQLYDEYLLGIRVNFEQIDSGINLSRANGRLGMDPLSWLVRGSGAQTRKAQIMQEVLGSHWRDKIHALRNHLPLPEEVQSLYEVFVRKSTQSLTYEEAMKLRDSVVPEQLKRIGIYTEQFFHPRGAQLLKLVRTANKKSFGALFELEHPFERRFIFTFASPLDKKGIEVLDYVKEAKVLLVPKNRHIAQHIPDFEGYAHWEKSRLMEALIPYGQEAKFSLQEMRDAHVFALSSLAGKHSPAISMIDDAVAIIAKRTGSSVTFTDPMLPQFRARFLDSNHPDAWRYLPLVEERSHAMRMEQYIYQRMQIEQFASSSTL